MYGDIKVDPSISSEFYAIIDSDVAWHDITTHNNNLNFANQERWRGTLAIPVDLSRNNRSGHCSRLMKTGHHITRSCPPCHLTFSTTLFASDFVASAKPSHYHGFHGRSLPSAVTSRRGQRKNQASHHNKRP